MSKKQKSRKSKPSAKKSSDSTKENTTQTNSNPTHKATGKTDSPAPKKAKAERKTSSKASPAGFLQNLNRRKALKILAGVGVAGVGVSSLNAYDKNQRTLHDLNVLGQGQPVLVQIHDPGCPTCRRLKSAVSTAMKSSPNVLYRLADITTREGKALQTKYSVPHVTLLFFDGEGKHIHTTQGLQTPDQVRSNIQRYFS